MAVCGLPSIICFVLTFFLPESPKFEFTQGNEVKAIEILRKIYQINTGKDPKFYKVTGLIKDTENIQNQWKLSSNESTGLLKSMWNQSLPLIKKPHLKNTMIACAMQFGIFTTCNGRLWYFNIAFTISVEF